MFRIINFVCHIQQGTTLYFNDVSKRDSWFLNWIPSKLHPLSFIMSVDIALTIRIESNKG